MDMDFSPEDLAFRDEVRAFLKESLPEHLKDGARRTPGVFVEPDIGMEWHRILNEKGWLAYHWPEADGGTGWTPTQRFIFEKECALAGAPAISILGLRLVGPVICEFGTQEQKDRFLPPLLKGEHYWCQGYSEPGSGSDLASLKTAARLEGDQYVVNGSKIWTTHAHHADWIFALVRTDNSGKKQQGITFLLIPMDQPGVEVTPIHSMSGDHEVNQVFFTDAVTSVENRIGEEGKGWTYAKGLLAHERTGLAGVSRSLVALEKLRRQAGKVKRGNGSLLDDPSFKSKLARLEIDLKALEYTELRSLARAAAGAQPGPESSIMKLKGTEIQQRIALLTTEAAGPFAAPWGGASVGPSFASGGTQSYLGSRAYTIYGGASEVQKDIIAKNVLGLKAKSKAS